MKIQDQDGRNASPQADPSEEKQDASGVNGSIAANGPAIIVKQWTDLENSTAVTRQHNLELKPEEIQPGQTVLLRALAWDKRAIDNWGLDLKPQEAATPWHAIKIIAEDAKNSAALEQLESLRGDIMKILDKQIHARITGAGILKTQQLADRTGNAGDVRRQQVEIQKSSVEIVNSIGRSDAEERQTIKRVLNGLAFGDMLAAVSECDELVKLKSAEEFDQPAAKLLAAQDRIIDVLRKLLDVARQAEAQVAGRDEEAARRQPARRRQSRSSKRCATSSTSSWSSRRRSSRPARTWPKRRSRISRKEQEEAAQGHGRRRGRLGEVHEGPAFRPEQTARAGFRQLVDGQGIGRDSDRIEDGGRRPAEEIGRHRRAAWSSWATRWPRN